MSQREELEYILNELIPEFEKRLKGWNSEYTQERDLGVRGEFVGLYRKARKLKSVLWDGVDGSEWREDTRTILLEVVGHAFLALYDLDKEEPGAFKNGMDGQTIVFKIDSASPAAPSKQVALEDLRRITGNESE